MLFTHGNPYFISALPTKLTPHPSMGFPLSSCKDFFIFERTISIFNANNHTRITRNVNQNVRLSSPRNLRLVFIPRREGRQRFIQLTTAWKAVVQPLEDLSIFSFLVAAEGFCAFSGFPCMGRRFVIQRCNVRLFVANLYDSAIFL